MVVLSHGSLVVRRCTLDGYVNHLSTLPLDGTGGSRRPAHSSTLVNRCSIVVINIIKPLAGNVGL